MRRVLAALSMFAALSSHALQVNTIYLDDTPGNEKRVLEVKNESAMTQFVSVEITKVNSLGEQSPLNASDTSNMIIASPSAFTLKPGQVRSIKINPLFERSAVEKQFIVTVKPAVSPEEAAKNKVRALAAYGVRYIHRPKNPVTEFHYTTNAANELVLNNTGNTSVLVLDGRACESKFSSLDTCAGLAALRVGAGDSRVVSSALKPAQNKVYANYQVVGEISTYKEHAVQTTP